MKIKVVVEDRVVSFIFLGFRNFKMHFKKLGFLLGSHLPAPSSRVGVRYFQVDLRLSLESLSVTSS